MQCNIDARGRAVRLIMGLIVLLASIGVIVSAQTNLIAVNPWQWFAIGGAIFGLFGIYEGWAGWCAVRAMGFRTKL